MATRFTSLGVTGAVTIGGLLTAGVVALTTLTATTGTFTTLNVRGTASGYTLKGGGGTTTVSTSVVSPTLSGTTIFTTAGASGAVLCKKNTGAIGVCGGTVGAAGKCGPCN